MFKKFKEVANHPVNFPLWFVVVMIVESGWHIYHHYAGI